MKQNYLKINKISCEIILSPAAGTLGSALHFHRGRRLLRTRASAWPCARMCLMLSFFHPVNIFNHIVECPLMSFMILRQVPCNYFAIVKTCIQELCL